MVKIIFLLKRKPDMSPEDFQDHYENIHVNLAHKYIGHLLKGYKRNYPRMAYLNPTDVPPGVEPKPVQFGYDCITEMLVENEAALMEVNRIFADPDINAVLIEDELKFLDRPANLMVICDEINDHLSA